MKGFSRLSLLLALIFGVAIPLQAETDLSVSGQVRTRGMADKTSFAKDANYDTFNELRTRLTAHAVVDGNVHAVIQLQDSRVFGEGGFSGTTKAGNNIDLHEGYIKIDNLFGKGWGAQVGRFEGTNGNERVFGSVGWSNVARSWDGGFLWWDADKHKVALFSMKKAELRAENNAAIGSNRDFDIAGAYVTIKDWNWDIFGIYEFDADDADTVLETNTQKAKRLSFGTYYHRNYEQFDFTLNGVVQTGEVAPKQSDPDDPVDTVAALIDVSALMATFEVGYSLQDERNTRVALGVDYQSGDDGSDATKTKAYSGLYPTAHKFQGYMDYFTGVPAHGLMDLMVRLKTDVTRGWTVAADFHLFTADKDYSWDDNGDDTTGAVNPTADLTSKDIGMEIDITVKTNRVAGVALQWGISYFMAKDDFADMRSGAKDKDPGLWSYSMATVNF